MCERSGLHRAHGVEATLKAGQRHAYSKRTSLLDQDMTGAGLYDTFDQASKLYRSIFNGVYRWPRAAFERCGRDRMDRQALALGRGPGHQVSHDVAVQPECSFL